MKVFPILKTFRDRKDGRKIKLAGRAYRSDDVEWTNHLIEEGFLAGEVQNRPSQGPATQSGDASIGKEVTVDDSGESSADTPEKEPEVEVVEKEKVVEALEEAAPLELEVETATKKVEVETRKKTPKAKTTKKEPVAKKDGE